MPVSSARKVGVKEGVMGTPCWNPVFLPFQFHRYSGNGSDEPGYRSPPVWSWSESNILSKRNRFLSLKMLSYINLYAHLALLPRRSLDRQLVNSAHHPSSTQFTHLICIQDIYTATASTILTAQLRRVSQVCRISSWTTCSSTSNQRLVLSVGSRTHS